MLLFASERSCFPLVFDGGAEMTIFSIAHELSKLGMKIMQLAIFNGNILSPSIAIFEKYEFEILPYNLFVSQNTSELTQQNNSIQCKKKNFTILLVQPKNFYEVFRFLLASNDIKLVVTSLKGSNLLIQISKLYKIPVLHRVFGIDRTNFPEDQENLYLIANSPITSISCKRIYNRITPFIYSPIEFENYVVAKRYPQYITFINPRKEKGLHIFCKICKMLPEIPFLLIKGWGQTQYGNDEIQAFKFLSTLSNVKLLESTHDIKSIYSFTKILIVPSVWTETFGRVILEAQINSIPVISSDKGNLPNTVGKGGLVIENNEIRLWIYAIREIYTNDSLYVNLCGKAFTNTQRFDYIKLINNFHKLITNIINKCYHQKFIQKRKYSTYFKVTQEDTGGIKIIEEKFNFETIDLY